mgnify:CR=1 FL=1
MQKLSNEKWKLVNSAPAVLAFVDHTKESISFLKKKIHVGIVIILVIAFIELSGYGILASLSRLLNAL